MSNGFYEYRLQQINHLLAIGKDKMNKYEIEELENERKEILHELRHAESLPTDIR